MAFTFFFRDIHTIEHIVRHVVPFASGRSVVKVWDAGCAMGPEPYTLAIVFAENMGKFAYKNLRIDATDIDGSNLFGPIIAEGVYPFEEIQRIPADLLEKYFKPADNKPGYFKIDEAVRTRLAFQKHDLLTFKPIGDNFSLIMCKNVLLHFSQEQRIEVIKMFHSALVPGGFFASEQTQKMPKEIAHLFEQVTPDAQLYRKL
jgi:chemotaxis protein methyltransferase CheR